MNTALVLLTNDDFMRYTLPMVNSFVRNNSWFTGDIVFIVDSKYVNPSSDNRKKLSSLYDKVKFYDITDREYLYKGLQDSLVKKYPTNRHWISVYYKYEIFRMTGYDKILYMDSDMIIRRSLVDLFNIDTPFGYVTENDGNFLNAGLLLLGNRTYINEKVYNGIMDLSRENGPMLYPEQDILREFFEKKVHNILPKKYNFMVHIRKAMKIGIDEADIVHYSGKKPEEWSIGSKERMIFEIESKKVKEKIMTV